MSKRNNIHGSPKSSERHHAGEMPGADQVKTGEPGSFARGVKATVGQAMSRDPPSGAAPKGLKIYSEE